MTNDQRIAIERIIAQRLITKALAQGFTLVGVDDGGDELEPASTTHEAVEAIFAVDIATLVLCHPDHPRSTSVLFVLGNGWDVISDYGANDLLTQVVNEVEDEMTKLQKQGAVPRCFAVIGRVIGWDEDHTNIFWAFDRAEAAAMAVVALTKNYDDGELSPEEEVYITQVLVSDTPITLA